MGDLIDLEINDRETYRPEGRSTLPVKRMLPYFLSRNNNAKYYHRVRYSHAHWADGALSHISITFWCGSSGFLAKGVLVKDIPDEGVLCAVCEGKGIGAGEDGERKINGRNVMYKPRINHE